MSIPKEIIRPSKEEQKAAQKSYDLLCSSLEDIKSEFPEIEIEETSERIQIPIKALKLLSEILKATSQGKTISIVPIATEVTTQVAAEMLGCSRPHLIKLLEQGKIKFTKVGKHRRIKHEDVIKYRRKQKEQQKQLLIELMNADEESGLYDS